MYTGLSSFCVRHEIEWMKSHFDIRRKQPLASRHDVIADSLDLDLDFILVVGRLSVIAYLPARLKLLVAQVESTSDRFGTYM